MGTWTLWIAFHAGVTFFLLLDFAFFHRRAHQVSIREAALESAAWVALSLGFGFWIYAAHGRGPGLEFVTGYLIEKSLSVDNVFLFLVIFHYFRVDPRYQHRLLFWGVLGALALRGGMVAAGTILIHRFDWILYVFGAFLLVAGYKLFAADHSIHPDKNPMIRWVEHLIPMSKSATGPQLFVRESGRWLATRLFLVVLVIETTDLLFAVDSVPAVFGVTRDPFLVYTSNICAILGLRALYFLLAGILPLFRYLDKGLAVILLFIGAKMLVEPWLHISTGMSLVIVCSVMGIATILSMLGAKMKQSDQQNLQHEYESGTNPEPILDGIRGLTAADPAKRIRSTQTLFSHGLARAANWLTEWMDNPGFHDLVVQDSFVMPDGKNDTTPRITIGVAVQPEAFEQIRRTNGSAPLADAPSDQDVVEFELEFHRDAMPPLRLDILTTKAPRGGGAIARFLEKFGEGIQQIEIDVTDVDGATQILREKFNLEPIFPATRSGANGTRVNFFLVPAQDGKKVLVELVEQPNKSAAVTAWGGL